ncbi:hypothetical protein GF324_11285 [bacterium]|nr:hypothetical protein [bacterium]
MMKSCAGNGTAAGITATALLAAFLLFVGCGEEPPPPIVIDGEVEDWSGLVPDQSARVVAQQPDAALRYLEAVRDSGRLLLRFGLLEEQVLQRHNRLVLVLRAGTGSDTTRLLWRFGARNGTLETSGGTRPLLVSDLDLVTSPGFSDTTFEVSIRLPSHIMGVRFNHSDGLGVRLVHAGDGTALPARGYLNTPAMLEHQPLTPLSFEKPDSHAVRIAVWNVREDGLLKRPAPFRRILRALQPDVLLLGEVFEMTAEQAADTLNLWVPGAHHQAHWRTVKHTDGSIVALRGEVERSQPIPDGTGDGFLIHLQQWDEPLFLVHAWAACCDMDSLRQVHVDRIAAFVRDARDPSGPMQIRPTTPLVLAGDFNLVGWSRQYHSLKEGRIVRTDLLGEGAAPDGDGTALADAQPRHFSAPFTYAWRNDDSGFTPGRLEMLFYSDSRLEMINGFVLHDSLPDSLKEAFGLQKGDVREASDHMPLVVDLVVKGE